MDINLNDFETTWASTAQAHWLLLVKAAQISKLRVNRRGCANLNPLPFMAGLIMDIAVAAFYSWIDYGNCEWWTC